MKFFKFNKKIKSLNQGFTLLVAIVVTSLLLIVGFVVSNVALKQIVLADAVVESQFAFYNADSGADCAVYWDLKNGNNGTSPFSTSTPGTISCRGAVNIYTGSQTNIATNPVSSSVIGGGGKVNPTSIFQVDYAKGCAIVRVTKQNSGETTVDSRGYNTCDTSSRRRYERGLTLTYVGNENTILGVTGNSESLGHISLSPSSLAFSADVGVIPASKTVTISNTGKGSMDVSATPDAGWCHVSLSSPTVNSGSSITATVSVDAAGSAGTYTCSIPVASTNADNSPQTITVSDNVSSSLNGFAKSNSIAINHLKVSSTLSNFPVLISGTYASLKTVGNGGFVKSSNGYDVAFTSDASCSTNLSWEVEKYVASTGEVAYWVKVPSVSSVSDTVIYICYGNSSIVSDQSNKKSVWDANYKAVWHLGNGTTLSGSDSTSNATNGTLFNSPTAVSGVIDGAGNFDYASNSYIKGSLTTTFPITVSGWFKATTWNLVNGGNGNNTIFSNHQSGNDGYRIMVRPASPYGLDFTLGGVVDYGFSNYSNLSTGTWYYFAVTVDANNGTAKGYLNGSSAQSVSIGTISGSPSSFGLAVGSADAIKFDGKLDEMRVSNIVRSDSWINAEYKNQSSPSTFYTITPSL